MVYDFNRPEAVEVRHISYLVFYPEKAIELVLSSKKPVVFIHNHKAVLVLTGNGDGNIVMGKRPENDDLRAKLDRYILSEIARMDQGLPSDKEKPSYSTSYSPYDESMSWIADVDELIEGLYDELRPTCSQREFLARHYNMVEEEGDHD